MQPLIDSIKWFFAQFGLGLDDNAVYFLLGVLVPPVLAVASRLLRTTVVKWSRNKYHRWRAKSVFAFVEPRLTRVSYFPIFPVIDIKDSPKPQIHHVIKRSPSSFRFAPELDQVESTVSDFIVSRKRISQEDPAFHTYMSQLKERIRQADFAKSDELNLTDFSPEKLRVFSNLTADSNGLRETKRKVLYDFLMGGSDGNGFLHNGKLLAVQDYKKSKNPDEDEELHLLLQETDYFSYRVIAELADNILSKHGLAEMLGTTPNHFSEYLSQFQANIHLSLGLGIIVHTYHDNRIIITRRSANAAQNVREAGKYFMSACEGINNNDVSGDDRTQLQPLTEIVQRAIYEELYGKSKDTNLTALIRKCLVTGSFLYLPNLSIELCVYVGLDCHSDDVRNAYHLAKDSGLETSEIIKEPRWDNQTGLPRFHPKSLHRFLKKTIGSKQVGEVWDEGAITALMLSSYVEDD